MIYICGHDVLIFNFRASANGVKVAYQCLPNLLDVSEHVLYLSTLKAVGQILKRKCANNWVNLIRPIGILSLLPEQYHWSKWPE